MAYTIDQQMEFSKTESGAICEMIAKLIIDSYTIAIEPVDKRDAEGKQCRFYHVKITNEHGSLIAYDEDYQLIDALTGAYQMTPERK